MSLTQNQANSKTELASQIVDSTEESVVERYKQNDKNYKAAMLSEYLSVATQNIIEKNEINNFKKYFQLIIGILNFEKGENPKEFNENVQEAIKNYNFVILACKYCRSEILTYIMDERNETYLGCCRPGYQDKENHNAFYYAIREDNKGFIEALLDQWLGYVNSEELYGALAEGYDESKLRNLHPSDRLVQFIAERLINYQFYSDDSEEEKVQISLQDIEERGKLLIESIHLFTVEYSNSNDLDCQLLLRTRFIVSNISILKQQMKATYSKIFWEEMEFYLLAFISSKLNSRIKNTTLYQFLMPKRKLINYLNLFANILKNEMKNIRYQNLDILTNYPKENRVKMMPKILQSNPECEEFYEDYQRVKDVYAFHLISQSVDVSLMAFPDMKDGQLSIKRTLQIIAEMIRNNWESPNMSRSLSLLLLTSLPLRTRQIIVNFHNSSYIYSQTRKVGKGNSNESEEAFFKDIQTDLKIIKWIIRSILHVTLIHYVTIMLETITKIENAGDLKNYIKSLELDFSTKWFAGYEVEEEYNYTELIEEYIDIIDEKTEPEGSLFSVLLQKNETIGMNPEDRALFVSELKHLKYICRDINEENLSNYKFQKIKQHATDTLDYKLEERELTSDSTSISSYILDVTQSLSPRFLWRTYEHVMLLVNLTHVVIGHGLQSYEWLEKLRSRLWAKRYLTALNLEDNTNFVQEKKELSKQVLNDCNSKIEALKNVFMSHKYDESPSVYKKSTTQAAVEMLTLEIMSIQDASKNLVDNHVLLDNPAPTLVGKAFYNYLVRSNILTIQVFDEDMVVFLNAKKLSSKSDESNGKKIGKICQNNLKELKLKYRRHLSCIINQNEMFQAIERGDFEKFEDAVNKGADVNGTDHRGWSSLHYAAKGGNLALFKRLINLKVRNKFRDMNGECPLHFAVRYGHIEIVKFLTMNVSSSEVFDNYKIPPLYIAVRYGYKQIVKLLLPHNNKFSYDVLVQCAVLNNHKDIVEILLNNRNYHVDHYQAKNRETLLHLAAKNGSKELTEYLISLKSDVNSRSLNEITPLHEAACYGYLEAVKILISNNADVNAVDINESTPLHKAAENKHEQVVEVLIKNGANVNKFDGIEFYTPLHFAVENGLIDSVKLLVEYKAAINAKTKLERTPLHIAAYKGHYEIAKILLINKAQIKAEDNCFNTPVHCAAINGSIELIGYLLRNGGQLEKKNQENHSPLYMAAYYGHLEVVKFLIGRGAKCAHSINTHGLNPLHASVQRNHLEVVKFFISHKVDINVKTDNLSTALSMAAYTGFYEIVKVLVEAGGDLNAKNNVDLSPLHLAMVKRHDKVIDYLLSTRADIMQPTKYNKIPIHIAAENNQLHVVTALLNKNIDMVHIQDSTGRTPLYLACQSNYPELVQFLINKDAKIIYDGMHCMDAAIRFGNKDVIDVLLKNGINVNGLVPHKIPFLNHAVGFENYDIIRLLIAKKANVNAVSDTKETALMVAADKNFAEIADILLKSKADPDLKNEEGYTAIDIAIIENSFETFCLLLESNKVEVSDEATYKFRLLRLAAIYDRVDIVKFLIEKGIDVNDRDKQNMTPLHLAAMSNSSSIVKLLLENGARYNARDLCGRRPVDMATDEFTVFSLLIIDDLFTSVKDGSYQECLDCLKRKAVVNAKDDTSLTPLHYACRKGIPNIVRLLIDFKADIHVVSSYGTPFVCAVIFEHYEVVKILLKSGAVYNVTVEAGHYLSDSSENFDITYLLKLIEKVFDAVRKCDTSIVDEIKRIQDYDILQCILNARNVNNKRLHLEARSSKFPEDKFAEIHGHEAFIFTKKYALDNLEKCLKF